MSEMVIRQETRKGRQRGQILTAALELFSERGYRGVTMHEVAEKAEVAMGTLHGFFKNEEELYKALVMEKAEKYHRLLKAAVRGGRHAQHCQGLHSGKGASVRGWWSGVAAVCCGDARGELQHQGWRG